MWSIAMKELHCVAGITQNLFALFCFCHSRTYDRIVFGLLRVLRSAVVVMGPKLFKCNDLAHGYTMYNTGIAI